LSPAERQGLTVWLFIGNAIDIYQDAGDVTKKLQRLVNGRVSASLKNRPARLPRRIRPVIRIYAPWGRRVGLACTSDANDL